LINHPQKGNIMNRIFFALAVSLAFGSASVSAQSLKGIPQPSFNDNAPIQAGPLSSFSASADASASSSSIVAARDFPMASFDDDAAIPYESTTYLTGPKAGEASTGNGQAQTSKPTKSAGWPQPSFRG
jgi:hypothetical protein